MGLPTIIEQQQPAIAGLRNVKNAPLNREIEYSKKLKENGSLWADIIDRNATNIYSKYQVIKETSEGSNTVDSNFNKRQFSSSYSLSDSGCN